MVTRDLSVQFETRIRSIVEPMLEDAVQRMMARVLGSSGIVARRGPGRPPGTTRKTATAASLGKEACNVAGCVRPMRSKGYCGAHYQSARKYGWPMPAPVGFNAPVRKRGRPPKSEAKMDARTATRGRKAPSRGRKRAGRKPGRKPAGRTARKTANPAPGKQAPAATQAQGS